MKGILLSNINMQPLVRALRPWDMSAGAYNSILADLSAADLPAARQDVTHVFCLYDSDTLMGNAFYGGGSPEQCEKFLQALDSFCTLHKDKIAIANLFSFSSNRWLGFADVLHARSLRACEATLNKKLISIARDHPNLLLLDLDLLFRKHGEDALLSDAFWYTARIRYTARMFELLAETIGGQSALMRSATRRCWSSISTVHFGAVSLVKLGRLASLYRKTGQVAATAIFSALSKRSRELAFCLRS